MYGNYFLAFCDILGFSDLVTKSEISDVVDQSLSLFRRMLHYSMHQVDFPETPPELSVLQSHEDVGLAWFSDSIFLYSRRDDDKAVRAVLRTVEWLIWTTVSTGATLVRCGISYGPAFIDAPNSLFVGRAIVEAAKLESQQAWAGGALTRAACDRLPEKVRGGAYADWPVRPYAIPLRDGGTYNGLAVEWTWGVHHPGFELRWSDEHEDPTAEDWLAKKDICTKFVNTRAFHDTGHCCERRSGARRGDERNDVA